ncbi:MAG: LysR family transcriptional regulator [Rhodobacteraceae bacterium]|nr:LysR family transcriptional regulator [Paracoccaceae bacterium]MAY44313.1 LysR family transcriptional regulator [Paracoccaceae bacterium]QEW20858.1 Gcv operon activator [Marinibacterium anthonyi]
MRRVLPSLPSLTVFEASARHGSFTRAAEELNMSQSAVSKRIATLEDWLGTRLFERVRQRIVLTEAGRHYLGRIREALEIMEEATMETLAFRPGGVTLNIATLPSFGNHWLLPRIAAFARQYPEISLNVTSRQWPFDMVQENIDAAIFYSVASWPGGPSDRLFGEEMIPVCRPGLIDPEDAAALDKLPLLHHRARPRDWQHWLEQGGLNASQSFRGSRFETFDMIIRGARHGLGVGLIPTFMAQEHIEAAELGRPFARRMATPGSYFLVQPERKRHVPAATAFRQWVLDEAAVWNDAQAGHSSTE